MEKCALRECHIAVADVAEPQLLGNADLALGVAGQLGGDGGVEAALHQLRQRFGDAGRSEIDPAAVAPFVAGQFEHFPNMSASTACPCAAAAKAVFNAAYSSAVKSSASVRNEPKRL